MQEWGWYMVLALVLAGPWDPRWLFVLPFSLSTLSNQWFSTLDLVLASRTIPEFRVPAPTGSPVEVLEGL